MSDTSATITPQLAQRLAQLTPQQRELLLRQLAAKRGAGAIATRARVGEALPLSASQRRIWFFERLQPGTGAYHVYGHHRLRGALDAKALARAFDELVRRHESLRCGFDEVAGEPRQTVVEAVPFTLARIDLSTLAPAARDAEAWRLIDVETQRPFDLARAPLLRASLVTLGEDDHLLTLVIHHIIADAWSRGVLFAELVALYNAYRAGSESPLPVLPLQFPDVVLWQNEPAQIARAESQLAFWVDALAGVTGVLDLPTDRPRSAAGSRRGGRQPMELASNLVQGLTEFARREGATLFMALLAAFEVLLARHAGQDDVVIGTPVANRTRAEFEPLIGLFVNTLAVRGDLSGDPSFRELLARTRAHVLAALDHPDVPLERVIDALRLERVPGRTPLFQTMFVLQNAAGGEPRFDGLEATWWEPGEQVSRFEITLSLGAEGQGFRGVLDYDADLFDAATMVRLANQYDALLRAALADPDRPISQLNLLGEGERRELLTLGDGGEALTRAGHSLDALVARQAATTPQAIALLEPSGAITYGELQARVNGIAHALRALDVGAETRVALLADRSADAVLGVLGILAAGGAYVPLDPGSPDERLRFMLDDCGARAMLVPPALRERAERLRPNVPVLAIDAIAPSDAAPAPVAGDRHAAYVIYTSGSTGQPKGVVIEHRGAVNLTLGFMRRHQFEGQRLLMIPPLIFDASVGDVFPALASGATLVLHPAPTELGPSELERYCRDQGVTAIDAPAPLWRRWSEGWALHKRAEPLLPNLRLMMIGGESVPMEQVRRFASVTGGRVALCNHYGPTEASVCATMLATRDGAELATLELPIGRPLPGVRLYVVDEAMQLLPRGAVGELCIGGVGVARGYLGRDDLSAEKFLPDPFADHDDARLYRTGDLARWNADGTLQFLGRRDHQTKLRGFRIELGEIEAALAAHPDVRANVAIVREDRPGDRRLVAYVVADASLDVTRLRDHLASRLPEAMIPAAIVRLDALPLTHNGKVDRRALPVPSAQAEAPRVYRAPATPTEHAVTTVWRDVLAREDIGVDDDFFALGGDSLSTLPLVFKLHAATGVELPLAAVFATPTIAGLARAIDDLRAGLAEVGPDLEALVHLPEDIDPRFAAPAVTPRDAPLSVLITGATGFLGAYLAREVLDRTSAELLCLVRAENDVDALRRVRANLDTYGLWRATDEARLVPVRGDLALPLLGLTREDFDVLARRADVIFHNGGQVNFLAPYAHLEAANVGGTREVLRLACTHRVKPVHLVSTLGVYLTEFHLDTTVRESDPPPRAQGQHGGYNQSKWVGEQLALVARSRGLPVAIYRPARITGDSRTGVSNLGDYFNAWIKGCAQLGQAPYLPDESFDMAPVDYVGRAIVRLALGAGDANGQFHFYNARRLPIPQAIEAMRACGVTIEEVPYAQWRQALIAAVAVARDNALAPFAGLFPVVPDPREPRFDCSISQQAVAASGLACPPADKALFTTYLRFLQARGFLERTAIEAEAQA